jgi:hypothetical protein
MSKYWGVLLLVLASILFSNRVLAQQVGPYDACLEAVKVPLGAQQLPFMLNGSLDAPPDIDFISLALPASLEVQVDYEGDATGVGTLENPLLGIYDSDCTLVESNDDIFSNPNSRVIFFVPDDGIVVLAATSCCDYDFVGAGSSNGSYVITIMNAPPFIGSTLRLESTRSKTCSIYSGTTSISKLRKKLSTALATKADLHAANA